MSGKAHPPRGVRRRKAVNGEGTKKSVQRKKRGGGRCRGRAAGAFALPCIPRESSAVFPCAVLAVHALCLPPTLRFIRIHADRCIRAPTDHLKTSRPVSASSMPHAQSAPTQCIRRTSAHKKRFHPIRQHCAAPPAFAAFSAKPKREGAKPSLPLFRDNTVFICGKLRPPSENQTMPCAIIASATLRKPAMFAPATKLPFIPYFSHASETFL